MTVTPIVDLQDIFFVERGHFQVTDSTENVGPAAVVLLQQENRTLRRGVEIERRPFVPALSEPTLHRHRQALASIMRIDQA